MAERITYVDDGQYRIYYKYTTPPDNYYIEFDHIEVKDKTLVRYETPPQYFSASDGSANRHPIYNYDGLFSDCINLVYPPTILPPIPYRRNNGDGYILETVTSMKNMFKNCISLINPPGFTTNEYQINKFKKVSDISGMFYGCTNLTSMPTFPTYFNYNKTLVSDYIFYNCHNLINVTNFNVEHLDYAFYGCTSLTGILDFGWSGQVRPPLGEHIFDNTTNNIYIKVDGISNRVLSLWDSFVDSYENVYLYSPLNNPNPSAVINVYRVSADEDTNPNSDGEWVYINVETTVALKYAYDNIARVPVIKKDDVIVSNISHASGTNNYTGWLYIGTNSCKISAIPYDNCKNSVGEYHSGVEVFVDIGNSISVMEFTEDGDGCSFGKKATKQNTLDSAWEVHSDTDVNCGQDPDNPDHILSQKQNQLTAGTGINIINDTISANIIDLVYPVGSIYMSANSTSPATFLGGSWKRITGKFLLAATDGGSSGASQAAGNTGGEATHTLTSDETPLRNHHHGLNNHTHTMSHTHKLSECRTNAEANGYGLAGNSGFQNRVLIDQGTASKQRSTQGSSAANTGGSTANTTDTSVTTNITAHNNMPPYLAVYIWERTA